MDWRGRLRELKRAGGKIAIAAAMTGCLPGQGCCNANPDPCCEAPKSQSCVEYTNCRDAGAEVEACYYHWDLSMPDLKPPADLVTVHDVGSDHD